MSGLFDYSSDSDGDSNRTISKAGQSGIAKSSFIPEYMFKKAFHSFSKQKSKAQEDEGKPKRVKTTRDAGDIDNYRGPWASFEGETKAQTTPLTDEQKANAAVHDARKKKTDQPLVFDESAIFYGENYKDYLGNSFLATPSGFKSYISDPFDCFIPKNRYYTYGGHEKGVSSIEFFPVTGRHLLSSGMDGVVRLWDVEGKKQCVQVYKGHKEAVRSVLFSSDGMQFMTVSYDKYCKVWDTETGKVLHRITDNSTPICGAFCPTNPHEILVGGDGKVTQWDLRANEIVQEYKDALAAVNTITFVGDNSKFVITSDDRTITQYDYGIPVVVKSIQDTELHAIASVAVSPNGKYLVGNAQNNQILVMAILEKIKLNRKKVFTGHISSGFACGLTFSPDSQFLASGDAEGNIVFWDFKSGRLLKKLKAHNSVAINVKWHPADSNIVASCSWDGSIKLWK